MTKFKATIHQTWPGDYGNRAGGQFIIECEDIYDGPEAARLFFSRLEDVMGPDTRITVSEEST